MQSTKEKLLITAAELFAHRGVDGVSTRELAKAAGVNLCAINYYFGSKQKLYIAVIEYLIETIHQTLFFEINNISLSDNPKEAIKQIIGHFFDFLCGGAVSDTLAMLMINEVICPSEAYEIIYNQILEPAHRQIAELVSKFLGKEKNNKNVLILTNVLFGQAVMFRIHKEGFLRRLEMHEYNHEILADIRRHIENNCEAILEVAGEKQ